MGMDIGLYAERWDDGCWRLASPLSPNPLYDPADPSYGDRDTPATLYRERNYALYGILCGQTNRFAVRGAFAGLGLRGLPGDVSPEIRRWYEVLGDDAYWASWLLLSEALALPWEMTIIELNPRTGRPVTYAEPYTGMSITYATVAGSGFLDGVLGQLCMQHPDPAIVRLIYWLIR